MTRPSVSASDRSILTRVENTQSRCTHVDKRNTYLPEKSCEGLNV